MFDILLFRSILLVEERPKSIKGNWLSYRKGFRFTTY